MVEGWGWAGCGGDDRGGDRGGSGGEGGGGLACWLLWRMWVRSRVIISSRTISGRMCQLSVAEQRYFLRRCLMPTGSVSLNWMGLEFCVFEFCIWEKPAKPLSNLAVVGLYMYGSDVFDVIRTLKPSGRGELEIMDVNNYYIRQRRMGYRVLDGYWSDAGTFESPLRASVTVRKQIEQENRS